MLDFSVFSFLAFHRDRKDSDSAALAVIAALIFFGSLFAVVETSVRADILDARSLVGGREANRTAPQVSSPLRESPFSMPLVSDPIFPDRTCSIADFGAVSGGIISNTESFRKAVEHCSKQGGGRVIVPKGIWKTGAIRLASNINLVLEKGSRIVFSNDVREYLPAVFSRFEGIELYNYSSFIYAKDCRNIAITGDGDLDGNGAMWHEWNAVQEPSLAKLEKMADEGVSVENRNFASPEDTLQPSFVQFVNCRNILIEGVQLLSSPSWTIHPIYSENILVRNVKIFTDARNTDGIAIDSSRNVIVQDSFFRTGDDAVVIKSGKDRDGLRVAKPSENIVVHDIVVENGHGGIAFGSEMSGSVRNVFAYNVNIKRADFGVRMKSMRGRGGVIENIFLEDIRAKRVVFDAIQMDMTYGTPLHKDDLDHSPVFRDISMKNISVEWSKSPFTLTGLPESPIRDLAFQNVHIASVRDGRATDVVGESYRDIVVEKLVGSGD